MNGKEKDLIKFGFTGAIRDDEWSRQDELEDEPDPSREFTGLTADRGFY
jgi:hypothetical protein